MKLNVAGTNTLAMVDSGNLVVNAMSSHFARRVLKTTQLAPYLTPLKCKIGTAQKGASMQLLGVIREPLTLRFGRGTKSYLSRPLVFEGLNSDFNLAGPFLAQHHIDQLHSQGSLRVQDTTIPLVAPKKTSSSPLDHISVVTPKINQESNGIYLQHGIEVPPKTGMWVECHVPAARSEDTGVVAIDPGGALQPYFVSALVQTRQQRCQLPVMNPDSQPLRLNEGTRYGTWEIPVPDSNSTISTLEVSKSPKATSTTKILTEDRKKWLLEAFKLEDSPWLKDDSKLLEATQQLILKYHSIFSRDDEYGTTKLVEHAIHTDDVPPIKCKGRPLNPLQQEDLKKQLQKWLDQKVIEPSNSPWSFGLIAVPKKNGKTRWCLDFRPLNAITKKDSFPLPNMEDNLARMAKSRVFSALDGTGAYHVVPIRKQDREKTAFSTPFGLFQFRQMPFGLCNAPATYSRLVQLVLADLSPDVALPYLDDTCLHTHDGWQHLDVLKQFFAAHQKAGLMLQPEKCQLFQAQVEYLGHIVSAQGIQPVPEYVKLVKEWPEPTSIKELRTFLGKVAYYRKFIPYFSHTATPLYNLLSKEAVADPQVLQLKDEEKKAFYALRDTLTKAPILAYPDFYSDKPFVLDTDWSHDPGAIGAVLSQEQSGEERVICYGARKLSKTERNYSSNKGELLAVIHFMRLWKYYLQPRPFVLRTDHQALKWLFTMEQPAGMTQRWLETLGNNNFTVQFRRGTLHGNADSLSRATHAREPTPQEEEEAQLETMHCIQALRHPEALDVAEVLEAQENDHDLQQVRQWLRQGRKPTKEEIRGESSAVRQYAALFETLHIGADQLLYRQPQIGEIFTRDRLCLPFALQARAIQVAHEDAGGHMGMIVTQHRLLHRYYFPLLHKTVEEYIRECTACQKKRPKPRDQRHSLVSVQEGQPFQKLAIDFVGPLQPSTHGNKYLLTVKDCFTRWIEAFPTKDMTAQTVASVLQREIFSRFGLPEQVHSDQGTAFTSDMMKELLRILNIQATNTPSYNPKSNPVERSHLDIHRILRAMIDVTDEDWETLLPEVLLGLRTARNRTTGVTPFYAVFGREAMLPIDYLYANSNASLAPRGVQNREFIKRLRQTYHLMRKNIKVTVERARQLYSGKLQGEPLDTGDLVWLFTPVIKDRTAEGIPRPTRKHASFWTGPWKIQRKISNVLFVIETYGKWNRRELVLTISIDRLSRFHQQDQAGPPRDLRLRDLQTSDEFLEQGERDPDPRVQQHEEYDVLEENTGSFPLFSSGSPTALPSSSSTTSTPASPSLAEPSSQITRSMTSSQPPQDAPVYAESPSPTPSDVDLESVSEESIEEEMMSPTDPGGAPDDTPVEEAGTMSSSLPTEDSTETSTYALRPRQTLLQPHRFRDNPEPVWWRKPIPLPKRKPFQLRPTTLPTPTRQPWLLRSSILPGRNNLSRGFPTLTLPSPRHDQRLLRPSAPPLEDEDIHMSDSNEAQHVSTPQEVLTTEMQNRIDLAAANSKVLKSHSGQDVTRHRTLERQQKKEEENEKRNRKDQRKTK